MNARHEALAEGVARCLGQRLLRWRPVSRGYSPALRLIVSCADGTSVFVKAATDTRTAAWLRTEYGVYSQVHGGFLPTMRAWVDDPCAPILVLEDLSGAVWQTPWTTSRITRVLDTLRQVAATPAPAWLPRLEERRPSLPATISGYFGAGAGRPVEHGSSETRALQVAQLRVALAWAVRALGLPPSDGSYSQAASNKGMEPPP